MAHRAVFRSSVLLEAEVEIDTEDEALAQRVLDAVESFVDLAAEGRTALELEGVDVLVEVTVQDCDTDLIALEGEW